MPVPCLGESFPLPLSPAGKVNRRELAAFWERNASLKVKDEDENSLRWDGWIRAKWQRFLPDKHSAHELLAKLSRVHHRLSSRRIVCKHHNGQEVLAHDDRGRNAALTE